MRKYIDLCWAIFHTQDQISLCSDPRIDQYALFLTAGKFTFAFSSDSHEHKFSFQETPLSFFRISGQFSALAMLLDKSPFMLLPFWVSKTCLVVWKKFQANYQSRKKKNKNKNKTECGPSYHHSKDRAFCGTVSWATVRSQRTSWAEEHLTWESSRGKPNSWGRGSVLQQEALCTPDQGQWRALARSPSHSKIRWFCEILSRRRGMPQLEGGSGPLDPPVPVPTI